MSAAPIVLKTVIFAVGRIVRVARPGQGTGDRIVFADGLLVGDRDTQGSSRGIALKDAAQNGEMILFPPGGAGFPLGPSFGQLGSNEFRIHRNSWRQAVQHHANGGAVALSEERDTQIISKAVLHGCSFPPLISGSLFSISVRVSFSRRQEPISSTSTQVMPPEEAFLSWLMASVMASSLREICTGRFSF